MGGKLRVVLAAASICAVALLVALASTAAGSTKMTIRVVEHATSDSVVDTGEAGDTEGDILWFANDVFDATDASIVGTDQGQCFRTSVANGAWECNWTTFLEEGSLSVQGPFYDTQDSVLAITGGTGAYRRAQGQMKLHCYEDAGTIKCAFTYKVILP